ncbi:hypothetical protein BOTBODRAFT_49912 [Botryobasidium botryosum FD-172 SS1]|uniref:Uncharacterized protein n=1 Tax=Botryobasidium botryosum (strain FD-172 SS1) TaxID=930990 RepID=A0A067N2R3_BOTB1|nr:hypothetical protein BOTBODRAFT_49912 [Botryobasidium botryosum FD-172 SS1]
MQTLLSSPSALPPKFRRKLQKSWGDPRVCRTSPSPSSSPICAPKPVHRDAFLSAIMDEMEPSSSPPPSLSPGPRSSSPVFSSSPISTPLPSSMPLPHVGIRSGSSGSSFSDETVLSLGRQDKGGKGIFAEDGDIFVSARLGRSQGLGLSAGSDPWRDDLLEVFSQPDLYSDDATVSDVKVEMGDFDFDLDVPIDAISAPLEETPSLFKARWVTLTRDDDSNPLRALSAAHPSSPSIRSSVESRTSDGDYTEVEAKASPMGRITSLPPSSPPPSRSTSPSPTAIQSTPALPKIAAKPKRPTARKPCDAEAASEADPYPKRRRRVRVSSGGPGPATSSTTTLASKARALKKRRLECLSSPPSEGTPSPDDLPNHGVDLLGFLISTLVFHRATSLPAPLLVSELLKSEPHLLKLDTQEGWVKLAREVLAGHKVFDCIKRKGKDADGNPLEANWFYCPDYDPDRLRAATFGETARPKRRATKVDPTYYYEPVSLNRWEVAAEEPEDA